MNRKIHQAVILILLLSIHLKGFSNDRFPVDLNIEKIKDYIRSNNDSAIVMLDFLRKNSIETKSQYGLTQYHFLNGFLLKKNGKILLAIEEFNSFIKVQNDSTNKESIDQLNRIASCYQDLSEFENAKKYYNIAVQLGLRTNYDKGVGDSYSGIGQVLEREGKYEKGMEFYLKSNQHFKEAQDSIGISVSYNNIGNIMYYQSNFDQALVYYKKAAHIDYLMDNELSMAMAFGNIGMIYQQLEVLDSSLVYNFKSLDYLEKTKNPFSLGTIYNNIALVYHDMKDYKTSLNYHLKSKSIKEEIGDKSGLATSLINIGNIMVELKDYLSSIDFYEKGLAICNELNTPFLKLNAYKGLSKAYQETGRYKEALDFYVIYSEMSDSLNTVESKNNVSRLEAEFETKQKEDLIVQQKNDYQNEIAIEKAKGVTKTIVIFGVVLLLIFVTLFFIVFYQKLRLTRKQNIIIEEKNSENELLLGEIHHRVKNNLQVISSLLSLQEKSILDIPAKRAISESKERVKSMGLIHKMLYQNDGFSGIEINEYIEKLLDGLMESFGIDRSSIQLETNFEPLKLDIDTAIPIGLMINELVINAFKYAFVDVDSPKLMIKLEQQSEGLLLKIKDNGKGDPEELNNSNSFGLKLVKSLVRQVNGVFKISYEDGLCHTILIKDYKLI